MREQFKAAAAVILVAGLLYVVYTQMSGRVLIPGTEVVAAPPEPDYAKLAELKDVTSVNVTGVLGGAPKYDLGGRNLFQYGPPKPPPPTPAELEAMRKAEEARLKVMEEEARQRAEEQKRMQEAAERQAREAQALAEKQRKDQPPPQPAPPPKAPPPPINYKLVGYLGPQGRRIAVFLSGKDIVLARKGEVLDGKFKVLEMGPESVQMGYVDPVHADIKKRIDLGP